MMPSLDHCVNNSSDMTTLTKTLEVFDTYKHREDKDSDEESFHLPLDDDESESKMLESVRNGHETEDDILNKFDNAPAICDNIDAQLEEQLLNDEEEKKAVEADHSDEVIKPSDVDPVPAETLQVNGHDHDESEQMEAVNGTTFDDEQPKPECTNADDPLAEHSSKDSSSDDSAKDETTAETEETCVATEGSDVPKEVEETSAMDTSSDDEKKTPEDTPMEVDDEVNRTEECQNDEDSQQKNQEEEKVPETPSDKPLEKRDSHDSKHNEDSEDLFEISIIRDAEEDNAENAYNEAHPEANQTEENEEYDDRTDEKMEDEKASNEEEEEEEMDINKNDDHLKGDDVDIEEGSLKLDFDVTKDAGSSDGESENANKTELVNVNTEQKTTNKVTENIDECRLDEVTGNLISDDGKEINYEDSVLEDNASHKTNEDSARKRPLSDATETGTAKKSRIEQGDVEIKEVEKPKEKLPLKSLLSLPEFMKTRKHNRRLTMQDLEEFCVQKICEAIVHKSELGDVHHQLKLQEQLIETMRKEIQQLTKQARDLEIVNKKLMNDLKQQTATQKPLNPLKITRSVGLQVKFTPTFDTSVKRRQPNAIVVNQKSQVQTTTGNRGRAMSNNATTNVANRQVASPQKPQQTLPKPSTPLLSQALQNRRVVADSANKTTNQTARPKPAETKPGAASASVIDLTDEDDKKDKNKGSPTKVVSSKNIAVPIRATPVRVNSAAQGIRLTSQAKVSPITSVVTSSTPQVMYVVQSSPQNVLSPLGPKAVVVNFQSTNGVLTSTLNGSAVSVIPKQGNTIQLKTMTPTKAMPNNKIVKVANKHPAPLPAPPIVRVTADKPLKPIPPKPHLTIRKTDTGIILQWKMPYELEMYEVIASYQLYAYQETSALPSTDMWRKVGDVKALALPMACTLTQFADKNKYYFAVRPVDIHKRIGMFSEPEEISL